MKVHYFCFLINITTCSLASNNPTIFSNLSLAIAQAQANGTFTADNLQQPPSLTTISHTTSSDMNLSGCYTNQKDSPLINRINREKSFTRARSLTQEKFQELEDEHNQAMAKLLSEQLKNSNSSSKASIKAKKQNEKH